MKQIRHSLLFFCFVLSINLSAKAQITLPSIISDGMILQRDIPLKIWGWAAPGEQVTLFFNGRKLHATAGTDKRWQISLPSVKAGGPYRMEFSATNSVVVKDILFGDVWLCAGQSNMVHQMKIHNITYAQDIVSANFSQVRQFWVPTATDLKGPLKDLPNSEWKSATKDEINDFSAVAYFFARKIYQEHQIPIGIINSSVGGTTIEAWTGAEGLRQFDDYQRLIERNKDTAEVNRINAASRAGQSQPAPIADKGLTEPVKWFDPVYVPKGWRNFYLPGYWEDQGIRDLDGVVWFRKEIQVPVEMTGVPAFFQLGRIIDADRLYVNGVQVGSTGYQYPQRRYTVAAGVLKPGKNVLVIRIENTGGKGGFVPDKPYSITANNQTLDLKGEWLYKVGAAYRPTLKTVPSPIQEQAQPTALFNAMIAPINQFGLKGVLWYQGESNVGNAMAYKKLLPGLIENWRKQFQRPNLPFYYVQLPNYGDTKYQPGESSWAILREAALETLKVSFTGMAVTIDLGEWNDIHPDNKKDVGERLALIAQKWNYGVKNLVFSGPIYTSSAVEGNQIVISFDQTGSGLKSIDGAALSQFEIAGADKKFVWAEAEIKGNQVTVHSTQVTQPLYVRYAWADNPVNPNLYNNENLPASPFRTDH
ncbi:MAG: sialate O-acetylesterase [Flavobacterium sp.]|nr:MAG: sialate O-acetylesterase [Flavobacterium sp.]